jgi:hypothetical protein
MNISNFGDKLRISRNKKSQEKEVFINLVDTLEQCWIRTNFLHENLKLDFYSYEENYYRIIEDLIFLKYGETIGKLILWFVYDRFDADGKILGVDVSFQDKPTKTFYLKNSSELWDLIEKINKNAK